MFYVGMGLEKLVKAVDFVTVPFRVPDRIVKAAYDAFAEWQERNGRDRFTLAKYSGIGFGLGVAGLGSYLQEKSCLFVGALLVPTTWYVASHMRDYAFKKGDTKVLDSGAEFMLVITRASRFPCLLMGVADVGEYLAADPVDVPELIVAVPVLVAAVSFLYLLDANTSGYENTKAVARNAYNYLKSIAPRGVKAPAPGSA